MQVADRSRVFGTVYCTNTGSHTLTLIRRVGNSAAGGFRFIKFADPSVFGRVA